MTLDRALILSDCLSNAVNGWSNVVLPEPGSSYASCEFTMPITVLVLVLLEGPTSVVGGQG